MSRTLAVSLCCALLAALPTLQAKEKESSIPDQIKSLRSLSATQRPLTTIQIANEVEAMPAGNLQLQYADALANLVTEGDQGQAALQAVADALSKALAGTPIPAKGDEPARPYSDLARIVHYEHATTTLSDPQFAKAQQILAAEAADVQKADFTLKDLHNHAYKLSDLRGKVVLVNFWATWCPPCRAEMGDLDAIFTHFQSQGLVVLSITDESPFKVSSFIEPTGYHPPVLLDPGGAVHKMFHVEGIPHTFVFDRDGKLIAVAIDQRTQRQFLEMLSQTDLHP